jgi:Na+/H+ antiporter NhaD/arsenite permease-like protein
LINNTPASILLTRVLISPSFINAFTDGDGGTSSHIWRGSTLASIMGTNLAAPVTLLGTLAGTMFVRILAQKGVVITYKGFARYGISIVPAVTVVACLTLWAQLAASS